MSDKSPIEWTDATWNPVTGCSKVSPGCANCYAAELAPRLARMGQGAYTALPWTPENAGTNVMLQPARLGAPARWREPRRIFVNSMSDLFHERVPDEYIKRVWLAMLAAPRHQYQVLTKRPDRMREWIERHAPDPVPFIWLGTSIENDRWTVRADALRETPAAVRFLSCEPLLGPLPSLDLTDIHWVIVGGESGVRHRPIRAEWVRQIRGRCSDAGVAFFFKQWGGRTSKSGGRTLDGRTWDGYPEPPAVSTGALARAL